MRTDAKRAGPAVIVGSLLPKNTHRHKPNGREFWVSGVQLKVTDLSGRETIMRVTGGMKARVWRRLQYRSLRRILAILKIGEWAQKMSIYSITILINPPFPPQQHHPVQVKADRDEFGTPGFRYVKHGSGLMWLAWARLSSNGEFPSCQEFILLKYGFSDWNESWLGWPWSFHLRHF